MSKVARHLADSKRQRNPSPADAASQQEKATMAKLEKLHRRTEGDTR